MPTTLGSAIIWGNASTNQTLTGLGPLTLLEGREHSRQADKDETRDADGDVSAVAYYNENETVSLRFAIAQSSCTGLPSMGSTLTLVDTNYTAVAAKWIVEKVNTTGTNTKAVMAAVDLQRYISNAIPA